jgi:uncharacterized protein
MIYCDTSLLVAALTPETLTARVQEWLRLQPAGGLCVSGWVVTELSSALAIKLRQGELTLEQRADVLTRWRLLLAENLVTIPVPVQAWDLAARFADRHELKLRAGDALHLSVASLGGHELATLDTGMAEGAVSVGVGVVEL